MLLVSNCAINSFKKATYKGKDQRLSTNAGI